MTFYKMIFRKIDNWKEKLINKDKNAANKWKNNKTKSEIWIKHKWSYIPLEIADHDSLHMATF